VKLSRVNTALLIAIIFINGYIVISPAVPGIVFWFQKKNTAQVNKLKEQIRQESPSTPQDHPEETVQNKLVIPSILLDEPVYEGTTLATLHKGLWHRPHTGSPGQNNNTVIVGHRFTYSNPRGTFYHLDQVHQGDIIGITWDQIKYLYKVKETKVVHANEMSVEAPTDSPQLTIYTCTPLWLPKDRLVVIAGLEKKL
jgi:sortase A